MQINYIDIAVFAVFLFFALRGTFRGAINELTGVISIVVGIVLARTFYSLLAPHLLFILPEHWAVPVAFLVILFATLIVFALCAKLLGKILDALLVGFVDHLLGAAAGGVKAFILCAALGYALVLFMPNSPVVRESYAMPYLLNGANWILGAVPSEIIPRIN